jgi:hypothetical protein
VGILAVAVLALAVGAIVLVATSGGSRSPAVDLRGVDWENASVPAAICGGEGAKTVEAFSVRLRDEIDLDALAAELLAVVDQTMQPTRASLWLRQPAKQR